MLDRFPNVDIAGYSPVKTAVSSYFSPEKAQLPIDFCSTYLTHTKGSLGAKPIILEPWQEDIVGTLFGWQNQDGNRRYRKAYIEIPKKNGKTTLAAAIGLFSLLCDKEEGADVFAVANSMNQARMVFDTAAIMAERMVQNHPKLFRGNLDVKKHAIIYNKTKSVFRVISADYTSGKSGYNVHVCLYDELHEARSRDMWETMVTATASRTQPLCIAITTAGWDRNSICWEQHQYAEGVRDGSIDDETFLPVLYSVPTEADWTKEETWKAANPNYGVSVVPKYITDAANEAQQVASKENNFRRYHLNQWTEQAKRWLPMEKWDACFEFDDEETLLEMPCYGGLDVAATTDLTCFVLLWRLENDKYVVRPYFFVPKENIIARERNDKVPYPGWAKQGFIELTDGNVVDYNHIRRKINQLSGEYRIKKIAIDTWNAMQLATELQEDGLNVEAFNQSPRTFNSPTKDFESLVVSGKISHNGHPVLRWNAQNAALYEDNNENKKPSKTKSSERIDGIVAAVMALGIAIQDNKPKESVYKKRGLVIL